MASRVTIEPPYPPHVLFSQSTTTIRARVVDATGTNMTGTRATFTTTAGTLSPAEPIVDGAGYATATLTAADHATVTVRAGDQVGTVTVRAIEPFTVKLLGPASGVAPATWNGSVSVEANRAVVNPPMPTLLTFSCLGATHERQATTPSWSQRCSLGGPGDYVLEAKAIAANGWAATAAMRVTVTAANVPPPPPPPPATPDGVTFTFTKIHSTATTATYRFSAIAQGGIFSGNLDWFFDYIETPGDCAVSPGCDPAAGPATTIDVTFTDPGLRDVVLSAVVDGAAVSTTQRIDVEIP